MRIFYVSCFLLLVNFQASGQPYAIEGGSTRHRFAQLNLGGDIRHFFSLGSQSARLMDDGQLEMFPIRSHRAYRLIIGGTHFWGHADFFLGIPLTTPRKEGFYTGTELGTRYFPWRIERRKFRPYVGVSWLPVYYRQGEGTNRIRSKFPVTAGLMYSRGNHLFHLGGGIDYLNRGTYYVDREVEAPLKTPSLWLEAGYKVMIETTIGAEKDWQSGRTRFLTDTLGALKRLDGLTLGIGPSAAIFLAKSTHNAYLAPFADQHRDSGVFPEFALGYYLHKPDLQVNLCYRKIGSEVEAFDFKQVVNRKALTLEVFKFFVDYHGFAAFAGPAISKERLRVREQLQAKGVEFVQEGVRAGVTFGWDIRPNRLQSWYLRTNLRYFPHLRVSTADSFYVALDQLEFNFIQLVLFPGRIF
jgi:hypothetical protein